MVDYDETMKKYTKNVAKMTNFEIFGGIFLLIQGGQGAIREGPEPIPELKKYEKNEIFKNWLRSTQSTPYLGDPKFNVKIPIFDERNLKKTQ